LRDRSIKEKPESTYTQRKVKPERNKKENSWSRRAGSDEQTNLREKVGTERE